MNDSTPIELLEYVTDDNHNPFREWLEGLRDRQARAKVRVRLNRIRLGNFGIAKVSVKGYASFEYRIDQAIVSILDAKAIQLSYCSLVEIRRLSRATLH